MSSNKSGITVSSLLEQKELEINSYHNQQFLSNEILHPRTQKPGLALTGYLKYLNRDRLQLFGKTEMGYLYQLSPEEYAQRLKKFLSTKLPGIIISESQEVREPFLQIARKYKTPILISDLKTSIFNTRISSFLYRYFSKKIRINGTLMAIKGQGVLIKGLSGIGKSETALELVNKGYQLISDDLIEFFLNANDEPVGRSIHQIKNWLEVRGLGIINIVDLYGVGALMDERKLDLVIDLVKWNPKKKYDRLGEEKLYFNILDKDIPMIILPVAPGRNLSTLVEVAVKYFISRKKGSISFLEHNAEGDDDV